MNIRLFWKILITFWIIFAVTFQATWIAFSFYVEYNRSRSSFIHIPTKMQMIGQLLQSSGAEEAEKFISHLPEPECNLFEISLLNEEDMVVGSGEESLPVYHELAFSPDGSKYLISFIDLNEDNQKSSLFNMPFPLILMGVIGGLLFSLCLAWNLSRPIKLLRNGFLSVSRGDLSIRLFSKLKSRHDEVSDLAKAFDSMVEQLHILIAGRQELLHDVSHELRTPLARLQLAIGLAQQNQQNIDSSLQRIELESQRLDQLIGEILTFSRSEQDNQLESYFDLQDLIRIVIDDANYETRPLGIQVKLILSPISHSIVKGNAEQIRRAIENVIRNAIRFSNKGQEVLISLKEVGKYLQIDVKDRGPGIEEHKLSSIFEPFVRIQSPQLGKGYGLGLAITRKTILAHNGMVEANNRATGGLCVSMKIPYWKA